MIYFQLLMSVIVHFQRVVESLFLTSAAYGNAIAIVSPELRGARAPLYAFTSWFVPLT